MQRLTRNVVSRKALERFLRDAYERPNTELPCEKFETVVDLRKRTVVVIGSGDIRAAYTFRLTTQGYLRFRPDWEKDHLGFDSL